MSGSTDCGPLCCLGGSCAAAVEPGEDIVAGTAGDSGPDVSSGDTGDGAPAGGGEGCGCRIVR
jgi:hypothetical protein